MTDAELVNVYFTSKNPEVSDRALDDLLNRGFRICSNGDLVTADGIRLRKKSNGPEKSPSSNAYEFSALQGLEVKGWLNSLSLRGRIAIVVLLILAVSAAVWGMRAYQESQRIAQDRIDLLMEVDTLAGKVDQRSKATIAALKKLQDANYRRSERDIDEAIALVGTAIGFEAEAAKDVANLTAFFRANTARLAAANLGALTELEKVYGDVYQDYRGDLEEYLRLSKEVFEYEKAHFRTLSQNPKDPDYESLFKRYQAAVKKQKDSFLRQKEEIEHLRQTNPEIQMLMDRYRAEDYLTPGKPE